jgi:arsenate reductase-like glutaredoxin family protein
MQLSVDLHKKEETMTCRCVPSVYVTIYAAPTSSETRDARSFFNRKGIPFEDLDISTDPQARQKIQELSGQAERPVIIVDEKIFIGFDQSQMESAVPSLF